MSTTRNHTDIESLEKSLERVNFWIANCDQKAGFLLAVLGVFITLVFSSDFSKIIANDIISPFRGYLKTPELYSFSYLRCMFFIVLVCTLILCLACIILIFYSITARLKIKAIQGNRSLVDKSYLFFASISSMNYNDFKAFAGCDYSSDLKSQIYINSFICTRKFKYYNCGLQAFLFMVIGFILMFVLKLMF